MKPQTVVLIVAGVAGALIAHRVIRGAASVGGAVVDAGRTVVDVVRGAAAAVNPLSGDNVFNRAANSVWETVTGTPGRTIGMSVEDWLKPRAVTRAPAVYNPDAEDQYLGKIARAAGPPRGALRTASAAWSAIDQEDADVGQAMRGGDLTRAGFSDVYPRLR